MGCRQPIEPPSPCGERTRPGNRQTRLTPQAEFEPTAPGRRFQSSMARTPEPPHRSRKLLVTTVTLDAAMAAEATMGDSRPRAATGMPTML